MKSISARKSHTKGGSLQGFASERISDEGGSNDISFTSLPDIADSSDVDIQISVDDIISTVSLEQVECAVGNTASTGDHQPVTDQVEQTAVDRKSEVNQKTTENDGIQLENDPHQSPVVTPVSNVGGAVIASTSLLNAQSFPFHNRSFPADTDSDVLPYPGPTVRKKKATSKQKFFLLTSKEAHETEGSRRKGKTSEGKKRPLQGKRKWKNERWIKEHRANWVEHGEKATVELVLKQKVPQRIGLQQRQINISKKEPSVLTTLRSHQNRIILPVAFAVFGILWMTVA